VVNFEKVGLIFFDLVRFTFFLLSYLRFVCQLYSQLERFRTTLCLAYSLSDRFSSDFPFPKGIVRFLCSLTLCSGTLHSVNKLDMAFGALAAVGACVQIAKVSSSSSLPFRCLFEFPQLIVSSDRRSTSTTISTSTIEHYSTSWKVSVRI